MAKLRYRIVDAHGDTIAPHLLHYNTRYNVTLRSVEFYQDTDDGEEVLEMTFEYLHGPGECKQCKTEPPGSKPPPWNNSGPPSERGIWRPGDDKLLG